MNDGAGSDSSAPRGVYIALLSIHGLVRGENIELGRDADTGGQVKYVVDLARQLGEHPDVHRVDLLTRRIDDKKISTDYSQRVEVLSDKANIVRIACGPRRYLRKETLWPYLGQFVENALQHFRELGQVPDVVHGHYADAGMAGSHLAALLDVPFVFTGHSLGYSKLERLLEKGLTREQVEKRYNISQRIEAEEAALDAAELVVTSTTQEKDEQYAAYANSHSRRMAVIPPGVNLSDFSPGGSRFRKPPIHRAIARFLEDPNKPMILALSRADERKNVRTLLKAYAKTPALREKANLVLVLGNRDNIREMEAGPRKVLRRLLMDIDKYDLYGHVAYPKHHDPGDVPDIYRLAAKSRGVFVNPALTEPFGLTIIEAAASGVPVLATQDGGPTEILAKCQNGLLVDPIDRHDMAQKLLRMLDDRGQWNRWARNGVKFSHKYYSWAGHVEQYMTHVNRLLKNWRRGPFKHFSKSRLPTIDRLIITDLDGTLFGNEEAVEELKERLHASGGKVGLGIATGRRLDSALAALKEWDVPAPDLMITSVGSEIHYGKKLIYDKEYAQHIGYRWRREALVEAMRGFEGFSPQPDIDQRDFKISYFYDPEKAPPRRELVRRLRAMGLEAQVIYSHGQFTDLLPLRASKGQAVRYLGLKWGLGLERILVAGDSGNDEDMLKTAMFGVVVGNYSRELEKLRGQPNIYFAEKPYAFGILEGAEQFDFFGTPHLLQAAAE